MPLEDVRDEGQETFSVPCPYCGKLCVQGWSAGPMPEVHESWTGRGRGRRKGSCRWLALPNPVSRVVRYVPIPDGERPGDWMDRYRVKWEERYQVRAYLARHMNGTDG